MLRRIGFKVLGGAFATYEKFVKELILTYQSNIQLQLMFVVGREKLILFIVIQRLEQMEKTKICRC